MISLFVYLLMFCGSAGCLLLSYKCRGNKRRSLLFMLISVLIPSIFSSIRYIVGTDYQMYFDIYEYIKKLSVVRFFTVGRATYNIEPFYYFLSRAVYLIGGNFHTVLFLIEFISVLFVILSFKEFQLGKYSAFALLLYYLSLFAPTMNVMRQGIAISFTLYSIALFLNKKYKLSALSFLIAFLWHYSAIVVLPVYFLYDFKNNRINKYRDICYCAVILLAPVIIQGLIFVGKLVPFLNYYFEKYGLQSPGFFNVGYLITIIPIYILILLIGGKKFWEKEKKLFFISFFQIFIGYAGYYMTWASRLTLYLKIIDIIIVSKLIISLDKSRRYKILLIVAYYFLYFIYYYYILNQNNIFPIFTIF